MAKADNHPYGPGVEPVEQPYSTDRGDNSRTRWVTGEIDEPERRWAMFCHLAGLAGLTPLLPAIGSVVAPLVVWQLKANEFPFVAEQGRRAVNFQLSMLLYVTIGVILCLVSIVGAFLVPIVFCVYGLIDLIFVLLAAVESNKGQHYHYPFSIRFFK